MTGSDVFICYKKSMNRADLISYKPTVLSRYPLRNNPLYALEETVALFCLPMGANLECWPATSARASSVTSSFVLTLANREAKAFVLFCYKVVRLINRPEMKGCFKKCYGGNSMKNTNTL